MQLRWAKPLHYSRIRNEMCTHFTCDDSLDSSFSFYLLLFRSNFFRLDIFGWIFFLLRSFFFFCILCILKRIYFSILIIALYRCRFGFQLWLRMGWDSVLMRYVMQIIFDLKANTFQRNRVHVKFNITYITCMSSSWIPTLAGNWFKSIVNCLYK